MIDPKCCRCGEELDKKGGVLLLPPDGVRRLGEGKLEADVVNKLHLCAPCTTLVIGFLVGKDRRPCTLENCGHMRQLDAIVDLFGMPRGGSVLDYLRRWIEWDVETDEWSDAVKAAHPAHGSESHDEWGVAMRMVGNRHSKGALVALVNWLLVRVGRAEKQETG